MKDLNTVYRVNIFVKKMKMYKKEFFYQCKNIYALYK